MKYIIFLLIIISCSLIASNVKIVSEPAGATVYIDDVELGKTPLEVDFPEGSYDIRLESRLGEINEHINISGTLTEKFYSIADERATLTIKTDENAKVFLNGDQIKVLDNIKLEPQICIVEARISSEVTLKEKIVLKPKEVRTLELFPEVSEGELRLAVMPADADVVIWQKGGNKRKSTGSVTYKDLPSGEYYYRVKKDGYKRETGTIVIEKNAVFKKSISLIKGDDISEDYIYVKGGNFTIYSNNESKYERPGHEIYVSDFYIGKYEVTQALWIEIMGSNSAEINNHYIESTAIGSSYPACNMTFAQAIEFCNKLSEYEELEKCYSGTGVSAKCDFSANGYRLPTDAEWQYASIGGEKSKEYKYSGSNNLKEVAQTREDKLSTSQPVGRKKPNELGIYDMNGNVREMCWDWFVSDAYDKFEEKDPTGPETGTSKITRGGGYETYVDSQMNWFRSRFNPDYGSVLIGLRLVRRP